MDRIVPTDSSGERNNEEVAVDKRVVYNYDMKQAPIGQKLILLTVGDIGVFGFLTGRPEKDAGFKGWFKLISRDKDEEERRGFL